MRKQQHAQPKRDPAPPPGTVVWSCGECDVLWQASLVSRPADPVLWSGASAPPSCIMSRTVHRRPCGCHCVRVSADAPPTALRGAPTAPGQDHELTWCVRVHGHRVWELHCAGRGLGVRWSVWLRVQRGAPYGTGHRRIGSVWPRALAGVGHSPIPSHPPVPHQPANKQWPGCMSWGWGPCGTLGEGVGTKTDGGGVPCTDREGAVVGHGQGCIRGGGRVGWGPPPSSQGPPVVLAEDGPKTFQRKSSWHQRRRSKSLAVSLKHWKGRRGVQGGGGGGGTPPPRLLRCTAVLIHRGGWGPARST